MGPLRLIMHEKIQERGGHSMKYLRSLTLDGI